MRFEYAELGECILSLVAIENAKKLGLSTEKRIALFDPVNGAVSHTMTSDQGRVESLCSAGLSFGSELVFFIVQEKCAGFWDSRDSKQSGLTSIICKYDGDSVEEEGFSCGSISGTFAVLGDNKGDIKIFDIRNSNHPLGIIEGMHTDSVRALEFHPSASSMLFSSSADGLINKYDLNAPTVDESLSSVFNIEQCASRMGFFGSQNTLAFAITDVYSLSIMDLETDDIQLNLVDARERLTETWKGKESDYIINCFYDYQSGNLIVFSGSSDGSIMASNLTTNESLDCLAVLEGGHSDVVRDIVRMDGKFVTAGEDGRLVFWSN